MEIDTTTTAGKIAVMQAFERGEPCEWQYIEGDGDEWMKVEVPSWNWSENNYRIKPRDPMEFIIAVPHEGFDYRHCSAHVLREDSILNSAYYRAIKVREVIE